MAKTKNKKKSLSENVHSKKESSTSKKVLNPFEVHINKEKMAVLGRKNKNDRGLPGVSRARALKKRKDTLLQEFKQQHKTNKFIDKRIGEKNRSMTDEDKLMARFTAIRKKQHHKKSIFNLADDEVLTHKGQTLSEIEKFDDPRSDDEGSHDEDNSGKLDSKFVKNAHFGGGLFTNTGKEGAKTHRELIDQLIAESKKRKAEKQKTKEANVELTEKLDTEWKDLLPLVSKTTKKDEMKEKAPVDDYDKVMRELRFEARGTVSDRLKTEDEIAKEHKEKLEELEKERLDRMQGYSEEKASKPNHRSADDLDDDFVYDSDPEYMLSYNQQGESNVEVDAQMNGKQLNADSSDNDDESDKEGGETKEDSEQDENKEDDSEEEDAETESEDDMSDLKVESSEDEPEEETEQTMPDVKNTDQKLSDEMDTPQSESEDSGARIKLDLQERKEMMEKAREELPFTFPLPESFEALQELFGTQSSNHQSVIIERMIKCNHPSLSEGNKDGLSLLFAYLLQHLNDCAADADDAKGIAHLFDVFGGLAPRIFELAQMNEENAHNSLREVIKEKHEEYRKRPKEFAGLEVLVFLKLSSLLFTTSDFRHQVVTPCFVFMEQMLHKGRIRNKADIAYGLFLTCLVLEYTALSRRYLPAAVNFLGGLLHMAVPKVGVKLIKVNLPFKPTSTQLVLVEDCSTQELPLKLQPADLAKGALDTSFKIRATHTILKLIEDFAILLADVPSNVEIFHDINFYLELLPTKKYPEAVRKQFASLSQLLANQKRNRSIEFIVMEAKRPKALRLYEPKIVEVYDGKRRKVQSKEKAERDKLVHKLKKETKGALREIRRDKAFLGRVKIQQRLQTDKQRMDKVKRIYSEAAMQQGELNSLDRQNKSKKT